MQNVFCFKRRMLASTVQKLSFFAPNIQCSSKSLNNKSIAKFQSTVNLDSTGNNGTENFLRRVTIIGSGHMGTGIAQVSAAAGNIVTVADTQEEALSKSKSKIEERLLRFGKKKMTKEGVSPEKLTAEVQAIMNRLSFTTDIPKSVEKSDLVVEAIIEDVDEKQRLFSTLDEAAPSSAIFVTNTSSIPVGEIGERLSGTRKERFGGVHFFNAVVMKLVEVIRTPETSDESFVKIMNWSKFIGKVPVVCKDTPGFIANRLNVTYFLEAIAMFERGDSIPEEIDIAMKLGAGHPFGPFELMDYVGLDVIYFIITGWEKRFPGHHLYRCPKIVQQKFTEGKWGLKTGEGFFKYPLKL